LTLLLAAATAPVTRAMAADEAPAFRLELNRLEPREANACRIWLVLGSKGQTRIDPLRLDLVLFGRDGVVSRRLAVDVGPLPPSRTIVRIFDIAGSACEQVGRVLLNDILVCGSADAAGRADCIDNVVLTSRVDGVTLEK
jgi:hypothetical protein